MTCRAFLEFLMEYLSGELSESERAEFDRHLTVCPSCRAYLKSYQATVKLVKEAFCRPEEPVPREVPQELVRAILAARATRQ